MNSVLKSAYKHTRNKFCKQRKKIVNIFLTSSQSKSAGFLIFFKKKVTDAKKKSFPNYCSIAAGVINGEWNRPCLPRDLYIYLDRIKAGRKRRAPKRRAVLTAKGKAYILAWRCWSERDVWLCALLYLLYYLCSLHPWLRNQTINQTWINLTITICCFRSEGTLYLLCRA